MPIYPGKKKGEHRVVVWCQGKPHERVVKGKVKEAEAFEARWRVEIEQQGSPKEMRVSPTFYDCCVDHYEPFAKLHLGDNTWNSSRKYQIKTLLTTELDDKGTTLGSLRMTEHSAIWVGRYQTKRKQLGLENISINNELNVYQAVRTYVRDVLKAPMAEFKWRRLKVRGRGKVTFWDELRMETFFTACEEVAPALLPISVFISNTGCRKGEAIVAESDWIDLDAAMIRIPINDYWQPKSNEPRDVPMCDTIGQWMSKERLSRKFLFPNKKGIRYAVFPDKIFTRVVKAANRLLCAKDCPGRKDKAKCDRRCPTMRGGPHTLRHTFAAHFLKAKPDLPLLAKLMGHSESKTTETYVHFLESHLKEARNQVNLAPGMSAAAWRAQQAWGPGKKR